MRTKTTLLTVAVGLSLSLTVAAQMDKGLSFANSSGNSNDYSTARGSKVAVALPEKLLANFSRNFPTASNAKWSTNAGSYLVNFTIGAQQAMASFDKKSEFVYALIYGKENDLTAHIQAELKTAYPSFTVYQVVEVRTTQATNYQVILQNATDYLDLRVSPDGKMEEAKRTKKTEG